MSIWYAFVLCTPNLLLVAECDLSFITTITMSLSVWMSQVCSWVQFQSFPCLVRTNLKASFSFCHFKNSGETTQNSSRGKNLKTQLSYECFSNFCSNVIQTVYRRSCYFHSKIVDSLTAWVSGKRKTGFSWTPACRAVSESRIFEWKYQLLR